MRRTVGSRPWKSEVKNSVVWISSCNEGIQATMNNTDREDTYKGEKEIICRDCKYIGRNYKSEMK